ncbi:MAG: trypsin-like peptidase domain-containing protein [Methylacidiphilales bacterium]|nr:trypsin-like peptidase domain-containing protein [Candidatus Methylacidiphilales bacterium]NJR17784.1 trypsin-like peptidase domain-containing protein [Calothrix sp. CSU_2_0]
MIKKNIFHGIKYFFIGIAIALLFVTPSFAKFATFQNNIGIPNSNITKSKNFQIAQQNKVLTDVEVESVASQTTVVIAPGLEKGDIENPNNLPFSGSGVIVAKIGKTYYVATNLHVVYGKGGIYGVYTPSDGEVHKVDDEKTNHNIFRFGEQEGEKVTGFDLAIVKFDSNKNYPLVTIDNKPTAPGNKVFVSGWPNPENLTGKMQRRFELGQVLNIQAPPQLDGGYSLFYDCKTQGGMSGGPVFNNQAQVVGIHGRGDEVQRLGILVNYLISQSKQAQQKREIPQTFAFNFTPPSLNLIRSGLPGKRPKSADVINNYFKTFSLENFQRSSTRDCPTGVLLGRDEGCEK